MYNSQTRDAGYEAEPPIEQRSKRRKAVVSTDFFLSPDSGLASEYLNNFNEIVMMIERLPEMPELAGAIFDWRPTSYRDYFARSTLPGSVNALDAYAKLDNIFRIEFDLVIADLDRLTIGAIAAIRHCCKSTRARGQKGSSQTKLAPLCARCGSALREALAQAYQLVNYGTYCPSESVHVRAARIIAEFKPAAKKAI